MESHIPSYGLRNPYRNLKSENSQDYAQKPQQNCTYMNFASVLFSKPTLNSSKENIPWTLVM
jgi:hypothetical protein